MKTKGEAPKDKEFVVVGTTSAHFERCEDKTKFEALLKTTGQSLEISPEKLISRNAVVQAPMGYSNVDGMCGIDVGLQMTLRPNHVVLGHQLAQQRNDLGLGRDKDYALIFHVPPDRFDVGILFKISHGMRKRWPEKWRQETPNDGVYRLQPLP